jgi:hypothetical protein
LRVQRRRQNREPIHLSHLTVILLKFNLQRAFKKSLWSSDHSALVSVT